MSVVSRDELTDRWLALHRSWPSDGWDGAAQARAVHNSHVQTVEAELSAIHAHHGHGPFERYGPSSRRCVCGQSGEQIGDSREFDRYGNWLDT